MKVERHRIICQARVYDLNSKGQRRNRHPFCGRS
jgi:hypothetical protein